MKVLLKRGYRTGWYAKSLFIGRLRKSSFGLSLADIEVKTEEGSEPSGGASEVREGSESIESQQIPETPGHGDSDVHENRRSGSGRNAVNRDVERIGREASPNVVYGKPNSGLGQTDEEYIQEYLDSRHGSKLDPELVDDETRHAVIEAYSSDPEYATPQSILISLRSKYPRLTTAQVWDIMNDSGIATGDRPRELYAPKGSDLGTSIQAIVEALGGDYSISDLRSRLKKKADRQEIVDEMYRLIAQGKIPEPIGPRRSSMKLEDRIFDVLEKYPRKYRLDGLASLLRRPIGEVESEVRALHARGLLRDDECNRLLQDVDTDFGKGRIEDRILSVINNWKNRTGVPNLTLGRLANNFRMTSEQMRSMLRPLAARDDVGNIVMQLLRKK